MANVTNNANPSNANGGCGGCDKVNNFMRFQQQDDAMFIKSPCRPPCCSKEAFMYLVRGLCLTYALWHTIDVFGYDDLRDWSHSFVFLTNWGAIGTCIYFTLAFIMCLRGDSDYARVHEASATGNDGDTKLNTACWGGGWSVMQRFQFIMFQVMFVLEFTITVMYWFAIYDWGNDDRTGLAFLNNISVHGLFFVLFVVELYTTRAVFTCRSLVWTIIVSVVYLIVNIISTFDYEPVYSVLEWDSGSSAIVVVECYFLVAVGQGLGMLLVRGRDKCCCGVKNVGNGGSNTNTVQVNGSPPRGMTGVQLADV